MVSSFLLVSVSKDTETTLIPRRSETFFKIVVTIITLVIVVVINLVLPFAIRPCCLYYRVRFRFSSSSRDLKIITGQLHALPRDETRIPAGQAGS